jgi:hypothetical protein
LAAEHAESTEDLLERQKFVKLDCSRLKPTNAVNASHHVLTHTPNATEAGTKRPATRRITVSGHMDRDSGAGE